MNTTKTVEQLKEQYPGATIIAIPSEEPSEIVCEVEPTSDHPEYSIAISVIDRSAIHYHLKSTETYHIIKGELDVYIDGIPHHLKRGEFITIKPNSKHYAIGNETWVECRSEPGWTAEDHHRI